MLVFLLLVRSPPIPVHSCSVREQGWTTKLHLNSRGFEPCLCHVIPLVNRGNHVNIQAVKTHW